MPFQTTYLNIKPESIEQLYFWKNGIDKEKGEYFDLKEKFIRPFCIVFLDQVLLRANETREIRLMPWDCKLHHYLDDVGFKYLYGSHPVKTEYNTDLMIKLKRFNNYRDDSEVVSWIEESIFPFFQGCDRNLKKHIVENLNEIIENYKTHSETDYGISICGQAYPKKKYFELAFYDSGIGLANKVKKYGSVGKSAPDSSCIKWALQRGTSTRSEAAAGLGLFNLNKFIKINGGTFQFISGNGLFYHDNGAEHTLRNKIPGTLVNIRVNINDNKYTI